MAPCLRKDLVATMVDEQGVTCIEVTDPVTAVHFRFYDFEYALAQELTGQPLDAVAAWAAQTYGLDLSAEALDQFIDKLEGLGFLVGGSSAAQSAVLAPSSSPGSGPSDEPAAAALTERETMPGADGSSAVPAHLRALAGPLPPFPASEAASLDKAPNDTPRSEPPKRENPRSETPRSEAPQSEIPRSETSGSETSGSETQRDQRPREPRPGETLRTEPPRFEASSEGATVAETPLGAVAHAIVAELSGPPPLGSLEAVSPSSAVSARDAVATSGGSWVSTLADEVESPARERRQPPRPEIVVMPPVADQSAALALPRRRSSLWLVLLVLGAAAGAAAWFFRPTTHALTPSSSSPSSALAPTVHVVAPQPTTFYRWFDTLGVVAPGRDETLGFVNGGRVQDVMPPGTTFSAGETLARLQGVAVREMIVNRLRARVAYAQQLRDRTLADGNQFAVRLAEARLVARKQELGQAQAALVAFEIHPKSAGEIAELLVQKGDIVKALAPVFRIRATGPRATFSLPVPDATRARALTFCRVETIPGNGGADGGATESKARPIDCSLSNVPAGNEGRFAVDLIGAVGTTPGTQARLASARYDGVFAVPRSAVASEGGVDHLWIVGGAGKLAENRAVEVAATVDNLALIAHGIAVGDAVVIDPPAGLKTGAEINVVR